MFDKKKEKKTDASFKYSINILSSYNVDTVNVLANSRLASIWRQSNISFIWSCMSEHI